MNKPDLTADQALGVALSVQSPSMLMDDAQSAAPWMSAHLRAMGYSIDPLRAPAADEEPWLPGDPELDHRGPSFLDGAVVATGWWVYTTAAVVAALVVVLVAIGVRRAVR